MADRRIFRRHGPDTHSFLQGLVTNDINRLEDGLVYTAILTPQGKYLADFFLAPEGNPSFCAFVPPFSLSLLLMRHCPVKVH